MPWRRELGHNITDIAQPQTQHGLNDSETARLPELCAHFPMPVPQYYLRLID